MRNFAFILLLSLLSVGNIFANNSSVSNADYLLTRFYKQAYLNSNKVIPVDYKSSGDKSGKPISYAFDNDWKYYWQSASNSGEQSITVDFGGINNISKMVYGLREGNPFQNGEGYAREIEVYSSNSVDDNDFKIEFTINSEWNSDRLKSLLCFERPISARRIKLVFGDILNLSGNYGGYAEVAELIFLKSDPVFDDVMRMFEDESQMVLREEYKDDALLDSLEREAASHTAINYLTERIRHAKNLLQNKIKPNDFPYPVEVIQKTGPDSEKYVMVFFAERYTVFERENCIATVKYNVEEFFKYEPINSLRGEFNIYLVLTPSNQGGSAYTDVDSYFGTYLTSNGDGGGARVAYFTTQGKNRADSTITEFTKKYLDEGGFVHCASFIMNSNSYGGAAHNFCNGATRGLVYTLNAGSEVLTHEAGHAIGRLSDEYCYVLDRESTNITEESDGTKSRWKEFLSFRYTTHHYMCGNSYVPSTTCLMGGTGYGYDFCEVCRMGMFCSINDSIENKRDWYIANPIVYFNHTSTYPFQLEERNIIAGNGYQLQFRTVVKNLTQTDKTAIAEFKVVSADGSTTRFSCRNEIFVPAQEIKSVTALSSDIVNNLEAGDRFIAKVFEKESNKELIDYSNYKDNYGTVNTQYLIGNDSETTFEPVEGVTTTNIKYPAGLSVEIKPFEFKNYTHRRSSITGEIDIKQGETTYITHYHTRNRGAVTLRLLDENNNEIESIVRYVDYGKSFTPSQNDFNIGSEYSLILPTDVATFDGINDMELTYKLTTEPTSVEQYMDDKSGIVVLFPNPNNGNFKININNDYVGNVEISCVSLDGKVLRKFVTQKDCGEITIPVEISEYKGLTIINIVCGTVSNTASVIIK